MSDRSAQDAAALSSEHTRRVQELEDALDNKAMELDETRRSLVESQNAHQSLLTENEIGIQDHANLQKDLESARIQVRDLSKKCEGLTNHLETLQKEKEGQQQRALTIITRYEHNILVRVSRSLQIVYR